MADFKVGQSVLGGPDTFEAPASTPAVSPLPTMQYLIAFNNGPLDNPASITSIAQPPGAIGGVNVWTDITNWVSSCSIARGRQHELSRFESGTCTLDLNNGPDAVLAAGGRFNPWNTSSPYSGKLLPMKQLQVRSRWNGQAYYRFTGHINAITPQWNDPVAQFAQISANDGFRFLNQVLLNNKLYSQQVIADGATAYWQFLEQQGSSTIGDSTGRGNTGVLQGGSQPDNANISVPVVLSGAPAAGPLTMQPSGFASFGPEAAPANLLNAGTPDYIDVTGAGVGTGDVSFTIEAWVKIADGVVNANVFGHANSTNVNQYTLRVGWNDPGQYHRLLGGVVNGSGTGYGTGSNFGRWTGSDWHQVVLSYTAGGNVATFLDGNIGDLTVIAGSFNFTTAVPTVLGALQPPDGTSWLTQGGTVLSNVSIYNLQVLSPAQIALHYQYGVAFPQGSTGTQIRQALSYVGWPAANVSIDNGVQLCQTNNANLQQTSALSFIQTVEQTEGGALFMTRDGKVRFISRDNIANGSQSGNVQAWFGDDVATATAATWDISLWDQSTWGSLSIPFEPGPTMALDDLDIVNQAIVTRNGGQAQTANDLASQNPVTGYGLRSQAITSLLHLTDTASLAHAQWVVAKLAQPVFRMRTIHVNLLDFISDNKKVATVLGLDLMHRVKVNRYQVGFEQVGLIERYEEKITPDSWDVTLSLSPTDTYQIWGWGGAQ